MAGSSLEMFMESCKGGGYFSSGCWGPFECTFSTKPKEFVSFAKNDLESECDHKLVNALSNVKRAIHGQVDTILMAFHLYELAQKKEWGLPTRIDRLRRIGIVSPRVLEKINRKRNLLEHEYVQPLKDEVEDALDVAILFIEYTDHYLGNVPQYVILQKGTNGHNFVPEHDWSDDTDADIVKVVFNSSSGVSLRGKWGDDSRVTTITISYESDDYLEFLRVILDLDK